MGCGFVIGCSVRENYNEMAIFLPNEIAQADRQQRGGLWEDYLRHNTWRFFDRLHLDIVGGSLPLTMNLICLSKSSLNVVISHPIIFFIRLWYLQ